MTLTIIRARLLTANSRKSLHWEGTFAGYFELAVANPNIAPAFARVYDMITDAG